MPALRLPDKPGPIPMFVIESRIPKPEELIVLNKLLLDTTMAVAKALEGSRNKWALGGDVAEIISGVNVHPDHIEIVTTKEGCEEIASRLERYLTAGPSLTEKTLEREAKVGLKSYPVKIDSYLAQFNFGGSKLEVHGDLRIKVGDWDWGDPVDYEPDYVYVVGVKVPVVPLQLKSEIYSGLGWRDRATKIHEAVVRSRHKFG